MLGGGSAGGGRAVGADHAAAGRRVGHGDQFSDRRAHPTGSCDGELPARRPPTGSSGLRRSDQRERQVLGHWLAARELRGECRAHGVRDEYDRRQLSAGERRPQGRLQADPHPHGRHHGARAGLRRRALAGHPGIRRRATRQCSGRRHRRQGTIPPGRIAPRQVSRQGRSADPALSARDSQRRQHGDSRLGHVLSRFAERQNGAARGGESRRGRERGRHKAGAHPDRDG